MRLLLDVGARPDRPRMAGGTSAFMLALYAGRFDVARLLLDRGADLRLGSDPGWTALFDLVVAAEVGASHQAETPELAAERPRRGVPVTAQVVPVRTTALMLSALKGHQPLVELLLAHGALVSLANQRGETALTFAERKGMQRSRGC